MRTIWLLAVMLSVAAAVRAEAPAARSADAKAIRQLYAGYDAAWNKGDLAGLAMVWADDADHVEPDGRAIKGRAAIAKDLAIRHRSERDPLAADNHRHSPHHPRRRRCRRRV